MVLKKILLVAADPIEISCILQRFNAEIKQDLQTTIILSSEDIQIDICILGYGCCSAMANLARHLLKTCESYDILINLGFAGILKPKLYPPLFLSEIAQVHKFVPKSNFETVTATIIAKAFPYIECSQTQNQIKLLSSDVPIFSSSAEHEDYDMVDMEGYGIAFLAKTLHIPYKLVKIGSDIIGQPIDRQYLRSDPVAPAKLLADWFENHLVNTTLFHNLS